MEAFEEQFKTKAQGPPAALSTLKVKVAQKAPSKVSLIEGNKAKNLAITLRKGGRSPADICTAIETYGTISAPILFLSLVNIFLSLISFLYAFFVLVNPFILFLLIPPSPNTLLLSLPYYLTSLPPSSTPGMTSRRWGWTSWSCWRGLSRQTTS